MPHISDARPTVTAKLGKNHTVQADGDTWDEILAVYEKSKRSNSTANSSSFLGGTLSYFGGKKKNNKNKNNNTSSNTGSKSKSNSKSVLIIRSYYQNRRTNKKVWDEPPSGVSSHNLQFLFSSCIIVEFHIRSLHKTNIIHPSPLTSKPRHPTYLVFTGITHHNSLGRNAPYG